MGYRADNFSGKSRLSPAIGCCHLNVRECCKRSFAAQDLKRLLDNPDRSLDRSQADQIAGMTAHANDELVLPTQSGMLPVTPPCT
jgi:hypothetical protein